MARLGAGLALAGVIVAAGCGGSRPAEPATTVTVYRVQNGHLHAERAEAPAARSTPAAALGALGLHLPVNVSDGTARVSGTLSPPQVAEAVYTLTRLPDVRRVSVNGGRPMNRAAVAAFVPPILIDSPADGQSVSPTFVVTGTASVYEGTLVVELRRSGKLVQRRIVTATTGAPARGAFRTTLHASSGGAATVVAFAPSAADGTPQHLQQVPVTVGG